MRLQVLPQNIPLLWQLINHKHIVYSPKLLRCHTIMVNFNKMHTQVFILYLSIYPHTLPSICQSPNRDTKVRPKNVHFLLQSKIELLLLTQVSVYYSRFYNDRQHITPRDRRNIELCMLQLSIKNQALIIQQWGVI